jgi:hypothetical protein
MTEPRPIFKAMVIGLVACIVGILFYLQKGQKEKTGFEKISGTIISIENTYEPYEGLDSSKYRYIQIDNYPKPFQIFVSREKGDFRPEFENINALHTGDYISVYFDETNKTNMSNINNLAYYIEKGNELVFKQGNSKKNLLYGLLIFCVVSIGGLFILKKKQKII